VTESASNSNATNEDVKGGCAQLNGLKMYYEIRGGGEALVLLHDWSSLPRYGNELGLIKHTT
jgi:hypothetical protein